MTQFRKKPVVITAITFDQLVAHGTDRCKAEGRQSNIVNGMPWSFSYAGHPITHENDDCYLIPTLEGTMKMGRDDMLITGVKGEIYPCKRDIFEATYDEVPDAVSDESSHDWRHSSSYGGQLCADCGAVKGSRRGGLKCSDPHAGAATVTIPVVDPGPDSLEREIQAKADKGPRVTPAALKAEIASAHFFTAADGAQGAYRAGGDVHPVGGTPSQAAHQTLGLLTICVLVLRNGFTVIGHSACASPENYNKEIGERIARENAERQIWPLLGFRLRDELARPVLTDADAAADLAGKPRPDNPTAEAADFLASVKACDLSDDAPCEACQ